MHFVYHRNMQDIADIPCGRDPSWQLHNKQPSYTQEIPNDLVVSVKNWRKAGNRIIIHIIF